MNTSILSEIGLTTDQAKTYDYLLQSGSLTANELIKLSGETRTNAYMSLAKLETLGLAIRDEKAKKLTYVPINPAKLEELLEAKQIQLEQQKQALKSALPELLTTYYANSSKPGIQFYEGPDSLSKVYQDHLHESQDVYFVRTPADEAFFGEELYEYMENRAKQGIVAHGIAPGTKDRVAYSQKNDKRLKRDMSYCDPTQYTAPVEISVYGNKTAFISFGQEVVASIIDSPQVAEAMKQLFLMAKTGLEK